MGALSSPLCPAPFDIHKSELLLWLLVRFHEHFFLPFSCLICTHTACAYTRNTVTHSFFQHGRIHNVPLPPPPPPWITDCWFKGARENWLSAWQQRLVGSPLSLAHLHKFSRPAISKRGQNFSAETTDSPESVVFTQKWPRRIIQSSHWWNTLFQRFKAQQSSHTCPKVLQDEAFSKSISRNIQVFATLIYVQVWILGWCLLMLTRFPDEPDCWRGFSLVPTCSSLTDLRMNNLLRIYVLLLKDAVQCLVSSSFCFPAIPLWYSSHFIIPSSFSVSSRTKSCINDKYEWCKPVI